MPSAPSFLRHDSARPGGRRGGSRHEQHGEAGACRGRRGRRGLAGLSDTSSWPNVGGPVGLHPDPDADRRARSPTSRRAILAPGSTTSTRRSRSRCAIDVHGAETDGRAAAAERPMRSASDRLTAAEQVPDWVSFWRSSTMSIPDPCASGRRRSPSWADRRRPRDGTHRHGRDSEVDAVRRTSPSVAIAGQRVRLRHPGDEDAAAATTDHAPALDRGGRRRPAVVPGRRIDIGSRSSMSTATRWSIVDPVVRQLTSRSSTAEADAIADAIRFR